MKIAEIFHSIQGEGLLAGVSSAFVRTTGCNLRCHWCDTPYTSWTPEGRELSIERIVQAVAAFGCRHVVITGGEPMIAPDIAALTHALADADYHITIETAATRFAHVRCDLASLSPKLANSTPTQRENGRFADMHERDRLNVPVIQQWVNAHDHQLKFVIEDEHDLGEIFELLAQLRGVRPGRVLLMPQGVTPDELAARSPAVAALCKQHGFRYCPRLHVQLYGNTPGT